MTFFSLFPPQIKDAVAEKFPQWTYPMQEQFAPHPSHLMRKKTQGKLLVRYMGGFSHLMAAVTGKRSLLDHKVPKLFKRLSKFELSKAEAARAKENQFSKIPEENTPKQNAARFSKIPEENTAKQNAAKFSKIPEENTAKQNAAREKNKFSKIPEENTAKQNAAKLSKIPEENTAKQNAAREKNKFSKIPEENTAKQNAAKLSKIPEENTAKQNAAMRLGCTTKLTRSNAVMLTKKRKQSFSTENQPKKRHTGPLDYHRGKDQSPEQKAQYLWDHGHRKIFHPNPADKTSPYRSVHTTTLVYKRTDAKQSGEKVSRSTPHPWILENVAIAFNELVRSQ